MPIIRSAYFWVLLIVSVPFRLFSPTLWMLRLVPAPCLIDGLLQTMTLDVNEDFHEKKLLELRTLHQSNHRYIVRFHGAFYHEGSLSFVLEFMDCGTFADLVKALGSVPERPLGKLLFQLLEGLLYLHKSLHIIHRDIKPQNILLNAKGQAKITDFGVSGELANTQAMAKTFVGTVKYMSPNRISGKKHSAKSDIWSLGLVALEGALGYYPYGADDSKLTFFQLLVRISFLSLLLDLLAHSAMCFQSDIVTKPAPVAPGDKFSPEFVDFIRVWFVNLHTPSEALESLTLRNIACKRTKTRSPMRRLCCSTHLL